MMQIMYLKADYNILNGQKCHRYFQVFFVSDRLSFESN